MNIDRETLQKLLRYGYSLTNDEDAAYDLLQSAIEVYLNKPPQNQVTSINYVRTIMRNRYIDDYRRNQRFPTESVDDHSLVDIDASSLESVVISEHDLNLIWNKIDSFDREILFLWAVEGYSMQEISDNIDVPRGTLLSRIHRLRKVIINSMEDQSRSGGVTK